MAELLLINPRRRRRAASSKKRRSNPSPAQRRARAAFAAAARARSSAARAANPRRRRRARRRNPVAPAVVRRRARPMRRANPIRRRARRRNPIGLGNVNSYLMMIKEGLIGGAGAVAVDVAYGYLAPYLPASLQRTPGTVSVGDGVKAIITVALGKLLSRPTRGLSEKAARGALTVQAHALIASFLPATVTLGYNVAAPIANMSNRIGPNRRAFARGGMGRYTAPGASQLLGLSRYTQPGVTQMIGGGRTAVMAREMGAVR